MRTRQVTLLALPVLWSALAVAVPPLAPFDQQQQLLATSPSPSSRWRSFTGSIFEKIWPPETPIDTKPRPSATKPKTDRPFSSHSLARYGGDIVLRFNISTAEEAESIAEAADTLLLDVWEFSKYWVDVRLGKDMLPSLLGLLPDSLQESHSPLLFERQLVQAIYETYPVPHDQKSAQSAVSSPVHLRDRPFSPSLRPTTGAETNIFFSDYQPLSVIQPWLRLLASLFTTHVRLINIGTTAQGREIPGVRVGVHPTNSEDPSPPKRKTVVIIGGLHAREWISTTTVNFVAYSLITAYGKNPQITKLLEDFDFVLIPTINPDGYVYTWETDRLWRKNRQQTHVRFCPGIDLDRSFGYKWTGARTAGNPCSEAFAGEEAFEGVEAARLASWARNQTEQNNVEFVGFLDLHSYSQEILYPYSWTCEAPAPGRENLEELAVGLEKTIRVSSGQIYEVMPACEGNVLTQDGKDSLLLPRIEDAGGSALDWFAHEMHVHYAYQIKLRDRGTYGFLLPPENIVPTGNEIWEAVLYFAGFLSDVYVSGESKVEGVVEMTRPDLEFDEGKKDDVAEGEQDEEVTGEGTKVEMAGDELDDDGWVLVEDVEMGDFNWDLKRRRRR